MYVKLSCKPAQKSRHLGSRCASLPIILTQLGSIRTPGTQELGLVSILDQSFCPYLPLPKQNCQMLLGAAAEGKGK